MTCVSKRDFMLCVWECIAIQAVNFLLFEML